MVLDLLQTRGLSPSRLGLALVLLVFGVVTTALENPDWPTLLLFGSATVFFLAAAFRQFREHALYELCFAVVMTVWGVALYVGGNEPRFLVLLFLGGGLVGTALELVNYWQGTTYGRLA
ncbi:hypothetical protein [Haloarchaeobius amylolyticus]|uniref:hypothetical protein n=1 Tax=Haloarchaeobius amylolyticus TaxID=1198296 RepID=UPI00226F09A1|nr:hypothetical protein [Haloarchaeobius amylolyticus]